MRTLTAQQPPRRDRSSLLQVPLYLYYVCLPSLAVKGIHLRLDLIREVGVTEPLRRAGVFSYNIFELPDFRSMPEALSGSQYDAGFRSALAG